MNIYLIEARDEVGYDSYDAHVVQAFTEHSARRLVPDGDEVGYGKNKCLDFWTSNEFSTCVLVGNSFDASREKCLLSSFNAG